MNSARIFIFLGGLFGAAGVGLSAAAAHSTGGSLGTAASMLLAHAPALLVLGFAWGLAWRGKLIPLGGFTLAAGVLLFAGDLVMRDLVGHKLFPMAAPTGGILMIAGWLLVASAAFTNRSQNTPG